MSETVVAIGYSGVVGDKGNSGRIDGARDDSSGSAACWSQESRSYECELMATMKIHRISVVRAIRTAADVGATSRHPTPNFPRVS